MIFTLKCLFLRMEESLVSNGKPNTTSTISDSTSSSRTIIRPSKRLKHGNSFSTKFKGVVPQHNGHWGAQIYAHHQRIWLGTFKTERDAAMAYDSAAIRLRNADTHRNFPWTALTDHEPHFQSSYTTEMLLRMIKEGSYESKFAEYLRYNADGREKPISTNSLSHTHTNGWLIYRQLFQKELTPSDVGKLNRLVIPKKFALKYFPTCGKEHEEEEDSDIDMQMVFYDRSMKLWKFRYCYWRSSQSFVFTRGWNQFVKEHQLKANDTVSFYLCESKERAAKMANSFCMIDAQKSENSSNGCSNVEVQMDLKLGVGQNDFDEDRETKVLSAQSLKPFKLFGVQIV